MSRLTDKRAIISGAATGIGAATARRFASEGARVAILDVNIEDGNTLTAEINASGAQAFFFPCDMADPEATAQTVEQAGVALGGLDVVFANAAVGTVTVGGTVESIAPEFWDLAFDVNVRGVYALCRAAIPHLRTRGGGSIIVTSSVSALVGVSRRPTHAYAAAKGALLSLVRAMAVTSGPEGIRVNALVPGYVRTRLTEDVLGQAESLAAALSTVPLGRYAEPEELAACALFLASDEASFVTGTMLIADGGQTAV